MQMKAARGNGDRTIPIVDAARDCVDYNCVSGSGPDSKKLSSSSSFSSSSSSLRAVLVPVSVMSLLMSFAFVF